MRVKREHDGVLTRRERLERLLFRMRETGNLQVKADTRPVMGFLKVDEMTVKHQVSMYLRYQR